MRGREADLAARDAVVLVVSFDAARRVGGYCRRHALPFACLVDEARSVYRAYGFVRASWLRLLTPRTLAPYIRHAFMTRGLPAGDAGQDKQQLGGHVVVDPAGRVALAHPSDAPTDRPTVEELLAAIDRGPVGA